MADNTVMAPEGWIPVERRWLGLDRATIRPALVVAALAVLMTLVIPAIDAAVPTRGTTIEAGQQVGLASNVVFTPAAGWVLTDGLLLGRPEADGSYPNAASVTDGALGLTVTTGAFDGTPSALLTRLRDNASQTQEQTSFTGRVDTIQTRAGDRGVAQAFHTGNSVGLLVAFVIDGTGIEVVASGPPDANTDPSSDLVQMITSIARGQELRR